jgi:hypothetical protein
LDVNKSDGDHPADVANLALMRISGILTSLSSLFDDRRSQYAVDVPFVAHSVKALVQLSEEATNALNELYNSCDLTIVDQVGETIEAADTNAGYEAPPVEDDTAEINFSSLRKRTEAIVAAAPQSTAINDAPASSYEELLQKVTAAEVFANAQASQIAGGETSMLLPILHSLKLDILRMKRVA